MTVDSEANCHTFRATGITAYLLNGGTLERAQAIAGHESPRTTQLYDRTADDITVEDIEQDQDLTRGAEGAAIFSGISRGLYQPR